MSTLKVDGIRSNSASSDAITLASDGTCTANITNNLSNRNLIINGAMQVAQRGTSSTSTGFQTVDRMAAGFGGTDEAPTISQSDVASGTTPYTLGFRKALKITNGNQTSGADTNDYIRYEYYIEAQDIANSGWNYTSASSYITLSFWVKSSVAQSFNSVLVSEDGTNRKYPFETGSLSANTWTKITKTIPGDSNLSFNNDNGKGLTLYFYQFLGNGNNSVSNDAWSTWQNPQTPVQTSTWYTTNDATWEITGLQLEVGSVATDFEHRSFAQELALCQRYYQRGRYSTFCLVGTPGTYYFSRANIPLFTPMRAAITGTMNAASNISDRYFAYKTWADQTNVTAAPASTSFASRASDGGDNPHTDIVSVDMTVTIASGSSNAALPANGPGGNSVYPIVFHDVELSAEL